MTRPETVEALTYDSDRLIREWRDRYTNRRTVSHQMLNDAEALVRDAITRERELEIREAKSQREFALERRERAVEMAEKRGEWEKDRLRREVAELQAKVENLSSRRTLMREERETVEQGTVVRLLAPTEPLSWSPDNNQVRPWMLGEIEEVAHRLRIGGATDSTELRFERDAIEACVPFAEFALPTPPQATPAQTPDPTRPWSRWWRWWSPHLAVMAALATAVALVEVLR